MKRLLILLFLLSSPAYAASTAEQTTPGFLTTSGCPYGASACYKPYSATNPLPVGVYAATATSGYVLTSNGPGALATFQAGGGASLPSQTGNSGKFLSTDGSNPSWAAGTSLSAITAQSLLGNSATSSGVPTAQTSPTISGVMTASSFAGSGTNLTATPYGSPSSDTLANLLGNPDQNFSQQLPHLRAAIARVAGGHGDANILFIGDSTTNGSRSFDINNTTGCERCNGFPMQLARMLNGAGIPAEANSFFGDGTIASAYPKDNRITKGSSWSLSSDYSLGGKYFTASTSTNALSFHPVGLVDTFQIRYIQSTTNGVFSWAIDGGTPTNVSAQGDGVHRYETSTTVTAPSVGNHTISVKWVSGGAANIVGFGAYNSTIPQVHILNAGAPGGRVADVDSSTNDWSALPTIAEMTIDACVIDLTINDWNAGTNLTTYGSNLDDIVTACKTSGATDVVFVTGNPSDPTVNGNASLATQQTYVDKVYTVAAALTPTVPVIDIFKRWGASFANATALGFNASSDTAAGLHPGMAGHADIAQAIYNGVFREMGGSSAADTLNLAALRVGYTSGYAGTLATPADATVDFGKVTDALVLPSGSTTQRPTGVAGMIRYNATTASVEAYQGSTLAWVPLGTTGTGSGITSLTGDVAASGSGAVVSTLQNTTTARNDLGLGTSATVNTGTSGATVPLLNGANTWSGTQTLSAVNLATDTTTGMIIATATGQKLGFYGTAGIVQPTGSLKTALGNLGLIGSPTIPVSDLASTVCVPTEIDGHTAASPTAAQLTCGATIYNYGQGASNVNITLPTTQANLVFVADVGTAQASNYWRFTAASAGTIYPDGGTTGKDYIQFAAPVVGNYLTCHTFKTGSSTYSWTCRTGAGTTSTN